MIKTIFLVTLYIVVSACDSPRNNRIHTYGQNVSESLKTKIFVNYNLRFKSIWTEGPYPQMNNNSSLLVLVYDSLGELTDLPEGLDLGFFALMPSMGHGLEDAGYFEKLSTGVYENKNIYFQMSGDWQLELSIIDQEFNELDKVTWLEFF